MLNMYNDVVYNNDTLRNITQFFNIRHIENDKIRSIYQTYVIEGWKSPENVAYDFYGSCDEVWAILVANNIVNPFEDWLMKDDEVREYTKRKYGPENFASVHHYELDKIVYTTPVANSVPITNIQYELDANEKKRKIKIIRPELLQQIKEEARSYFLLAEE